MFITGDASLKKISENQITSDTFLVREGAQVFAGTCNCVSNSNLGWGLSAMEEFGLDIEV